MPFRAIAFPAMAGCVLEVDRQCATMTRPVHASVAPDTQILAKLETGQYLALLWLERERWRVVCSGVLNADGLVMGGRTPKAQTPHAAPLSRAIKLLPRESQGSEFIRRHRIQEMLLEPWRISIKRKLPVCWFRKRSVPMQR